MTKNTDTAKKTIGYGVKIPTLTFEEAINVIKDVTALGGENGSIDALAEVMNNSPSSSTFNYKISALKNFGLLESADKSNYLISDLAKRIVQPTSENEEAKAMQESFIRNENLNKIWENYKGKVLPEKRFLGAWIAGLNIPNDLTVKWADFFIEGAKFAGLLTERDNNSYQVLSNIGSIVKKKEEKPPSGNGAGTASGAGDGTGSGSGGNPPPPRTEYNIDSLFSGLTGGILFQKKISGDKRRALIFVPEDLTENDIKSIEAILESVKTALQGLKKDEAPE